MILFRKEQRSKIFCLVMMLAGLGLSACDQYEKSWTTSERLQMQEGRYFEQIPLYAFTPEKISDIARQYMRGGDGSLVLSVTYDPASKSYTASSAGKDGERFVRLFRENGVYDLNMDTLPVQENAGHVLVSFSSLEALAPEDCTTMPGFETPDLEQNRDYKIGCTVETLFARQVARPRDLKGQTQTEKTVDGRRTANTVGYYRDGVPNEPLEGQNASGE